MKNESRNRTKTYLQKSVETSNQRWLNRNPKKRKIQSSNWNGKNTHKMRDETS